MTQTPQSEVTLRKLFFILFLFNIVIIQIFNLFYYRKIIFIFFAILIQNNGRLMRTVITIQEDAI